MTIEKHMLDRRNPEYTRDVVEKKPNNNDPKEVRIRELIREEIQKSDWAPEALATIRQLEIDYLKEVIPRVDDAAFVHERTQAIIKKISELLRARIVEGQEHLASVKGKPSLVMTNHLGLYKLSGVNPKEDLGVDIPGYDMMYPSPLYFAGLNPVAEAMGNDLSYVSDDFPGVFGEIHTKAGFIHVPPAKQLPEGRTAALRAQTEEAIARRPHTSIVNFPEGGTSGKYNGKGPYDLEQFKTGGYVIAAQLGMPVVLVAQYFHPVHGLMLKVFPPYYINKDATREEFESHAQNDQARMQEWLNTCKASI